MTHTSQPVGCYLTDMEVLAIIYATDKPSLLVGPRKSALTRASVKMRGELVARNQARIREAGREDRENGLKPTYKYKGRGLGVGEVISYIHGYDR